MSDSDQVEVDLNESTMAEDSSKALNDDLFFSTISDPSPNDESENKKKQKEDMDDIFRENAPPSSKIQEIKLTDDEDDDDPFDPNPAKPAPTPANISLSPQKSAEETPAQAKPVNGSFRASAPLPEQLTHTSFDEVIIEDEEDRDKFLDISLSDPTKIGDGMGSYMVYKLTVKVMNQNITKSLPRVFHKKQKPLSVQRKKFEWITVNKKQT